MRSQLGISPAIENIIHNILILSVELVISQFPHALVCFNAIKSVLCVLV